MKFGLPIAVACSLLSCAQAPVSHPVQTFEERALAEFRGVGVATLPAVFDIEREEEVTVRALSARGVTVRDALLAVFKNSEVNLLIEDEVTGTASFDIKRASVEESFEALLETFDLAYRWDGKFLRIGSTETRVFDVDYPAQFSQTASAGAGLDQQANAGGMGGAGNMMAGQFQQPIMFWDRLEADLESMAPSENAIVVNRRIGTVSVNARPSVVRRVESYLEETRRRSSRQVSIEARIIEVTLRNEFRAGVDWSLLPGFFNTSKTGTLTGGAIMSQGAATGADTFRVGLLNAGQFSLLIDALEIQGQVRILSSPRVSTLHNVPAEIRVVEQVPVIEREIIDSDGVSRTQFSVRFEDAGVIVGVTPQIGEDGVITAHVRPSIVEVSGFVTTPDQLVAEPILNTREVTTILRIPDGQPVVLGGLRSERKTETIDKVPLLGDVPILGHLFSSTTQELQDTELIVMLTPRILTPAWETEDVRRSLARIRRMVRPFRALTIAMNTTRQAIEDHALTGQLSGADESEHEEEQPPRKIAGDEAKEPRLTPGGLARLAFKRARTAFDRGDLRQAYAQAELACSMNAQLADAGSCAAALTTVVIDSKRRARPSSACASCVRGTGTRRTPSASSRCSAARRFAQRRCFRGFSKSRNAPRRAITSVQRCSRKGASTRRARTSSAHSRPGPRSRSRPSTSRFASSAPARPRPRPTPTVATSRAVEI